jgi:glycosyltransferase involved in cell wall biosynthesis
MLRVQLVCLSNFEGGMEKHIADLATGLVKRGHIVSIICGKGFMHLIRQGVEIFEVPVSKARFDPFLLFQIWRVIHSFQPEILHCHGGKASRIGGILPVPKNTVKVCTVHGLKRVSSSYGHFNLRIGVSKAITNSFLLNDYDCVTIYNGLETNVNVKFEDGKYRREGNLTPQFTWVAVGRLVPVKGFDLAIKALALTKHNLIIVGEGPERRKLENLVVQYHLEHRVKFLGYRSDVTKIYAEADGTLITSEREGFSYVFLESMLAGTPVVATDVPVANEILSNQYICNERSAETLAEVMRAFAESSASNEIQADEMLFCQRELSLDAMVLKTDEAYRKTIEQLAK